MNKPGTTDNGLTIGRLAESADINVETVRYYQRIGLIETPAKPPQGFRRYSNETVGRLRFIKRAQELGFTLSEISELLELDKSKCRDVRSRAEQKRNEILQRIRDLQNISDTLEELIVTCRDRKDRQLCPIVESLQGC